MSLLLFFTRPRPVDLPLRGNWSLNPVPLIEERTTDHKDSAAPESGGFPTQFSGLRAQKTAAIIDLCLVAEADAPVGMGGAIKINKNGTNYVVYLVEIGDANASPVRVQTTAGVKSIRLKT